MVGRIDVEVEVALREAVLLLAEVVLGDPDKTVAVGLDDDDDVPFVEFLEPDDDNEAVALAVAMALEKSDMVA